MALVMTEYLEVNCIGVVLLGVVLYYSWKQHDKESNEEQHYFCWMLGLNALILLADNLIYLLRGHGAPALLLLNHLNTMVYFFMHPWFCYCWLRYVILRLYQRCDPGPKQHWAMLLPALLCSLPILCNPFTGWVFSLSAQNVYHRGPFIWVTFVSAVLYWIAGTLFTLREMAHPVRSRERSEYLTLLLFPLPLLLGNILQMLFYGLSIVWILSAIAMLLLFIDRQNGQLSRDELTGVFNRRQTN